MSTIGTYVNHSITIGSGNYTSPLTITSSGAVVDDSSGVAVYGPSGAAWTVANQGVISAPATGAAGVLLETGGLVDNSNQITGEERGVVIRGAPGTVLNSGTIAGHRYGVGLAAGGMVINFMSGTIAATPSTSGYSVYGITLSAGGTVTNYGEIVYGVIANGATATVTNFGTISGSVDLKAGGQVSNFSTITSDGDAVILGAAGTVNNNGRITAVGQYAGGVVLNAAGTVNNSGTIAGGYGVRLKAGGSVNNNFGLIAGGNYGVFAQGMPAAVTNAARILATNEIGVDLEAGGTVIDSGIISSGIGTAVNLGGSGVNRLVLKGGYRLYGIALGGTAATNVLELGGFLKGTVSGIGSEFVNFGTVIADAGVDWTVAGYNTVTNGITVAAGGTLGVAGTNASRGTAVTLANNDDLRLQAGGTIQGSIAVGTGDTLSLGGLTPGTFSISQLLNNYAVFPRVQIDPGATWTQTGTGTIGSGVTFTDFGLMINTGTLFTAPGRFIVDPASLVNRGVISGTVTLADSSYLGNTATGTIGGGRFGVFAAAHANVKANVVNFGSIGSGNYFGGVGVGIKLAAGTIANLGSAARITGYAGGIAIFYDPGTVTNKGTIAASQGTGISLYYGGPITNNAGGVIQGSYRGISLFTASPGYTVASAGVITNAGVIAGGTGLGILLQASGTVITSGTISGGGGTAIQFGTVNSQFGANGGNLLVLQAGYHIVGGVVGGAGATNTLELGGSIGAALTATYNSLGLSNFQQVRFGPGGNDTLKVTNTGSTLPVTVSGFALSSDVIDLTAIGTNGSITGQSSTLVTVTGSLGSETLRLDPSDGTQFTVQSDGASGTDLVACFCRGTLILTERGEVPVEELAAGDRVVTMTGQARPVRWIGRRAYDGRFINGRRDILPVCVTAGALDDGVPARDLFLSPEHSLCIEDVLVQAKHLVNGTTIAQAQEVDSVEYFHIELDTHDVIFAEGTAAETYIDCDNRLMFSNAGEYWARYPDDERPRWTFCRTRLEWEDPALTAIRAALFARARELGHGISGELDGGPDLHLVVDGRSLHPERVAGRVYRFVLPAGAGEVLMASRSAVPAELDPRAFDIRRLGIAVEGLVMYDDAGLSLEAEHSHPALRDGFHPDEGNHRWTDGKALLPSEWLRCFPGGFTLEISAAPTALRYPPALPPQRAAG